MILLIGLLDKVRGILEAPRKSAGDDEVEGVREHPHLLEVVELKEAVWRDPGPVSIILDCEGVPCLHPRLDRAQVDANYLRSVSLAS